MGNHPYIEHKEMLRPALISKMEEFHVFGYNEVTVEEIWDYLIHKVWKKPQDHIRTYQLVSDVLSINIGHFMNHSTIEAFKSPNLFADINNEDLQELLQPKAKTTK